MSIEDTMFMQALDVMKIVRRKSSYEKANRVHKCEFCTEENATYRLKPEFVTLGNETPYLFICEDCYKELEDQFMVEFIYGVGLGLFIMYIAMEMTKYDN